MPVIGKEVFLVSDANPSYRYFARDNGISHRAINLRAGVRVMGAIHIQNVNAYHSRFRGWLERFNGVATAYLQNYLAWRWIIDAKEAWWFGKSFPVCNNKGILDRKLRISTRSLLPPPKT